MKNDGFISLFFDKLKQNSNKKTLPIKMKFWEEYNFKNSVIAPSYQSIQLHSNSYIAKDRYKPIVTLIDISNSQIVKKDE